MPAHREEILQFFEKFKLKNNFFNLIFAECESIVNIEVNFTKYNQLIVL